MDNPAFRRIHRLKIEGLPAPSHLFRGPLGYADQGILTAAAVTGDIHNDTDACFADFVGHQRGQILNGIQCFTATPDGGTTILTGYINVQRVILR
jgi:hypothetical protein